ncbi:MAG: enoyl-CoA hydratase/isomerase family protein [Proteobacteria bacterium]|nr:enoyl-CoA hydratase/isomerase family protein [Pseudomonadota bacterium]
MDEPGIKVKMVERDGQGRVAHVAIDNRTRLNCVATPLLISLREAFEAISGDDGVRAVVLTGAGDRSFVGGADLKELGGATPETARLFITRLHMACKAIRECPVPVIARVNGFCLGAGLEIAASADMRVVAEGAVLGMPEVVMGLPSVIEAALLPGLIGWGKTREILLTGETFGAAEALQMGFAQKMVPSAALDAAVEHWVAHICKATPKAVRSQKALMNRWEKVSVAEGVYAGIDALSDAYQTGEPQAAIKAFFEAKAKDKQRKG